MCSCTLHIEKYRPQFLRWNRNLPLKCSETERQVQIRTSPKHTVTEAFRDRKIQGLKHSQDKESQNRYVLRQLELSEILTIAPLQRYSILSAQ